MDEGVVEGGEDTGNTENEFTWKYGGNSSVIFSLTSSSMLDGECGLHTLTSLGAEGDVLLRRARSLLGSHFELRLTGSLTVNALWTKNQVKSEKGCAKRRSLAVTKNACGPVSARPL